MYLIPNQNIKHFTFSIIYTVTLSDCHNFFNSALHMFILQGYIKYMTEPFIFFIRCQGGYSKSLYSKKDKTHLVKKTKGYSPQPPDLLLLQLLTSIYLIPLVRAWGQASHTC